MRVAMLLVLTAFLAAGAAIEEPAIVPGENLVLDGIPSLPASLAEQVRRYTEFRTASFRSWHPTLRQILISTRFGETNQVHWVKFPGGDRRQLTFFRERVRDAAFPRRSEACFLFTRDVGGDEFSQIYRYDVLGGEVTLLTDGKSQNALGPWSRAGDRMAYGSTRRNGRDRDLYVIDPSRPASDRRLLEVEGGGWSAADWSSDDRWIVAREYVSVNESHLWLVDADSGDKRLLTPKGGSERVSYAGAEFSEDGKRLFVTTDKDSEFQRLAWIDLATGSHTYLTSQIPWDVESFDLSPDGATLAFTTNEEGVSALHLLDTASGKSKPAGKPAGVIGSLAWHANSRDLAFDLSEGRAPYDVYSLDAASGKVERWTESETGGVPAREFSVPELVRFESFDGRTISGFLYKPPARFAGRRPVVVQIHGGPESQKRPDFLGRLNYYTNELGLALVFPNVRGSTGYGKSFALLDNGERREDSVRDIGALLDWIATRPDLDAERIMVTGASYGGYMTLAVAARYSDRIRCALDVVGISNFVTFLEGTEAYRRDLRRAEYGDERDPRMREFLESISPLNHAARIGKPLFVVQGRNDPRVPVAESEQIVARIKSQGTPVWYLMAKDEGHGFARKSNMDYQFYATVAFLQRYLLN